MIYITDQLSIFETEIKEEFIRSSGPGGQNINKVATAVQLRFNVSNSPSIPDDVKMRLTKLARNKINDDGVLIIDSRRFRSQFRNREVALNRLIELVKEAAQKPKKRVKTKLPRIEKEKRLKGKKLRSTMKSLRKKVTIDE